MLFKSRRNLRTKTNGSSGLQIHNNQSMTKTTLTNSLPKTSRSHRKRRVTGRQRRTPENCAISTKAPGTTPMNVAQNNHWWPRCNVSEMQSMFMVASHNIDECLSVYGCISDTFLLYYWISAISLCISLLYLRSHFVPKIIRIILLSCIFTRSVGKYSISWYDTWQYIDFIGGCEKSFT